MPKETNCQEKNVRLISFVKQLLQLQPSLLRKIPLSAWADQVYHAGFSETSTAFVSCITVYYVL